MEAAKPILFNSIEKETFIKSKDFKIINDRKEFIISIGKSSSLENLGFQLKQSSLDNNFYYQNFYTLEELQNISKCFRVFDNIEEVIPIIIMIFEEKNFSFKFEDNNAILNLKINKIGKGEELISLQLKKTMLSLEEICENLSKEVQILKNKISEQETEIKILKEKKEYNELKEEIKLIKEENEKKDLIINELINWKRNQEKQHENNQNIIKETNEIDSKIIKKRELDFISNALTNNILYLNKKSISFKLIFRATRDGHFANNFHQKCDGIPKTITIIKTKKNIIFGGYINNKWNSNDEWIQNDEKCFLFSISLMKIYYPKKGKIKYYFNKGYGPTFSEFGLENNLFEKSALNIHTKNDSNCFFSGFIYDYEITGCQKDFQAEEIEVFQVIS